jgi:hypothetical protein
MAEVFSTNTPTERFPGGHTAAAATTPHVDVSTAITTPTDRVRWGPIFAGLFAALSALLVLSVLGIAVGLTAYDPNQGDAARNFGIGAGVWAAVSALIAFFIGGFLAARTAAVRGHNNGGLNGAMVWVVAIPLLLYMVGGGLARVVGGAAQTATQAAAQVASRQNPQDLSDQAQQAGVRMTQQVQQKAEQVTPQDVEQVKGKARNSAWGVLVSLLLGLGAATVGGLVGARDRAPLRVGHDRGEPAA